MVKTSSENMADDQPAACKISFKKRSKATNARKRKTSDDGSEDETSVIKRDKKSILHKAMSHKAAGYGAPSGEKVVYSSSDDEARSVVVSYKARKSGAREGPSDMGATATYDLDTAHDNDAQAVFERSLEVNKRLKDCADDKIYRGINNYTQYIEARDTAAGNASSGMVRKGPIRAPAHLRATVRWDYQPDICKDFKETGYCGFGDSCKFLHDRGDYKHGWQLEREAEQGRHLAADDDGKYEISSDEDDLPFKCHLCRQSFTDPIVTKCKHFFCEKCALVQYRKTPRCFICGQQTSGMFNPAKELIAKIERWKKANEKSEEEEETEDVATDDR